VVKGSPLEWLDHEEWQCMDEEFRLARLNSIAIIRVILVRRVVRRLLFSCARFFTEATQGQTMDDQ
jgi:hypothetical protein